MRLQANLYQRIFYKPPILNQIGGFSFIKEKNKPLNTVCYERNSQKKRAHGYNY